MSWLADQIKQVLMEQRERGIQPFDGASVVAASRPGRSDLSDWLELMEAVEALCPKWPPRPAEHYGPFKL